MQRFAGVPEPTLGLAQHAAEVLVERLLCRSPQRQPILLLGLERFRRIDPALVQDAAFASMSASMHARCQAVTFTMHMRIPTASVTASAAGCRRTC